MSADDNNVQRTKKALDKLHPTELGETKDFNNLSYDKNRNSFELDVRGEDSEYDHPLPYNTSAPNGEDSVSSYDEANRYDDESNDEEKQTGENLEEAAMHIENEEDLALKPEDELLSRTPEDDRDDLDEEGYPVNDNPKKF